MNKQVHLNSLKKRVGEGLVILSASEIQQMPDDRVYNYLTTSRESMYHNYNGVQISEVLDIEMARKYLQELVRI